MILCKAIYSVFFRSYVGYAPYQIVFNLFLFYPLLLLSFIIGVIVLLRSGKNKETKKEVVKKNFWSSYGDLILVAPAVITGSVYLIIWTIVLLDEWLGIL